MASSGKKDRSTVRRAPNGAGWYFGRTLRTNPVYTNQFVARVSDLDGCRATDLQRVMRAESNSGCTNLELVLSRDEERYFDDEECSLEPISFCLTEDRLTMVLEFSTESSMAPPRHSQLASRFVHDDYFDEEAAGAAILADVLGPVFTRNRASIVSIEPVYDYIWPPWRWRAHVRITTRARQLQDVYSLGADVIALAEAFGSRGKLTRDITAELVRAGHAKALIGQHENHWLDVKSQHYDLTTAAGQIRLAEAVAKFANGEVGGLVVVGMAGKKIPGGERINKVCPVPLDGNIIKRYQQAIEFRLYPPPDLLSIEPISMGDGGIVLIAVPPQPQELKPFLVHGAIVDGHVERAFISIVRRRGESSIPMSAPMIHATLSAGRALLQRGELPAGVENSKEGGSS